MAAYHGLAERFIMDNKTTALPASTGYYVLYYNKTIFDNAGLSYPSYDMTWDEGENLAEEITSGEGKDKIYGAYFHTWNACVQNWGVQDDKHTIMDTDYSFFKPAYEMALRMQKSGSLWDYGSLRSGEIHYSNTFFLGNVAMMPMGTWFFTMIIDRIKNNETDIDWGIATLPHPSGLEAGWTVGSVTPIAINQASLHKDEAWKFIKFITSDEGAKIYASYGQIPSRADNNSFSTIAAMDGMPAGSLEALAVKNIALDRPITNLASEVNQMLEQEHSLIMLGTVSVEEGLANMSKRSKEIQGIE
jgi:multiple sugar transport system substrate-binding protein